jgi:hypothetical protein
MKAELRITNYELRMSKSREKIRVHPRRSAAQIISVRLLKIAASEKLFFIASDLVDPVERVRGEHHQRKGQADQKIPELIERVRIARAAKRFRPPCSKKAPASNRSIVFYIYRKPDFRLPR